MSRRPCAVMLSSFAEKQVSKLPKHVQANLSIWTDLVEKLGIEAARKIPGYRDKPLKGERIGQFSARLNRSYRIFYETQENDQILLIGVLEVNKHEY